jgi:hypothetical protein
MRALMTLILALTVVLPTLPVAAHAERQVLTDAELDEITAGGDVCGLFGLSSPCTISYYEVVQPTGATPTPSSRCFLNSTAVPCTATAPPPAGTCTNCQVVTSTAGRSNPSNTSVTVKQSFSNGGTTIFQRNGRR